MRAQDSDTICLRRGEPRYPAALIAHLGDDASECVFARGDLAILERKKLALFCSVKCPGSLILKLYDLACALRDAGVTVISGFHSPMEKECLTLLLRGAQPVIICPARSIEGMRLPAAWKGPLAEGRLLLLSPFDSRHRRPTTDLARRRNEFLAALANQVLVAYAAPGGATADLCRQLRDWDKPFFTLSTEENANLLALGARGATTSTVLAQFRSA